MIFLSHDYWELRETSNRGRGIFAKKDIASGTILGDYIGKLLLTSQVDELKHGLYDMYFNRTMSLLANPDEIGVHLFNHSCSANCEMFPYKGHTLFFATRYIFQGEELTVQYLMNPPETNHICTHACYCGSIVCHGTMHTTFAASKSAEEFIKKHDGDLYEKILPIPLGEILPLLDSYPESIPDDPIYDLFGNFREKPAVYNDRVIPSMTVLRKQIRETGRVSYFENLNFYIYGIMNGLIVGMDRLI